MYNTHIHTFLHCDVPLRFLPLALVRVLATKAGFGVVSRLLNNLNPFSDNDAFDMYVKFMQISKRGSQQAVFEECMRFYPAGARFAILAMDMAFMGAGSVPRDYREQLSELAALRQRCPQAIPFIHIDPRRAGFMSLLRTCAEECCFGGVKIYPPLGYFPYDERLYPVYEYCTEHNLPVISHCSPYNPVHFKGSRNELHRLLSKSKTPVDTRGKKRKGLCAHFTDPRNWEYVLRDFPGLKVCLAHFGSAYYWKQYIENPGKPGNWFVLIKNMIGQYPNLYTDISFTLSDKNNFPLLKVLLTDETLRRKILFGSDFYMVETQATERRFGLELRAYLGEEDFKALAVENAGRFFMRTE